MFSLLPIRDWLYLGAIVALITGFLFYRHSLIVDGEQIAQAREVKAAQDQKARDDLVAKGVVSDLNTQIASLASIAISGVPSVPMRLCQPSSRVSASSAAGKAPEGSASPADVHILPEGGPVGIDVGTVMRDFAFSCGIDSAYRRAILKWALSQSQNGSGQK